VLRDKRQRAVKFSLQSRRLYEKVSTLVLLAILRHTVSPTLTLSDAMHSSRKRARSPSPTSKLESFVSEHLEDVRAQVDSCLSSTQFALWLREKGFLPRSFNARESRTIARTLERHIWGAGGKDQSHLTADDLSLPTDKAAGKSTTQSHPATEDLKENGFFMPWEDSTLDNALLPNIGPQIHIPL
jgi:hypothetical protein